MGVYWNVPLKRVINCDRFSIVQHGGAPAVFIPPSFLSERHCGPWKRLAVAAVVYNKRQWAYTIIATMRFCEIYSVAVRKNTIHRQPVCWDTSDGYCRQPIIITRTIQCAMRLHKGVTQIIFQWYSLEQYNFGETWSQGRLLLYQLFRPILQHNTHIVLYSIGSRGSYDARLDCKQKQ